MLGRPIGQPVTEGFPGGKHVRFGNGAGGVRIAARHRVEQRGVLLFAALLRFGEELEVVTGHHPDGLAQVGEEPGGPGCQVQSPVEVAVGGDDIVGALDGIGQLGQLGQLSRRDAGGGHLGRLTAQGGEDGEVIDRVLRGDADHRHAAARRDLDETLVGQLEQGFSDRGPADAELGRQLIEVQAVTRLQPAGEDPVAQLVGRLGPDGGRDKFDI